MLQSSDPCLSTLQRASGGAEIATLFELEETPYLNCGRSNHALYRINDDERINDAERESSLIVEGAKHGIEFSFVN